ncbi:MAG: hypothetical protein ISR65_18465 [Bacteriovoracaceae bacterium]|nr:hypothetical protein [candidate division KSB1 bacterium]MBL6991772.1 hypothetical protein [Bacteriovoracaceae bacterium]
MELGQVVGILVIFIAVNAVSVLVLYLGYLLGRGTKTETPFTMEPLQLPIALKKPPQDELGEDLFEEAANFNRIETVK